MFGWLGLLILAAAACVAVVGEAGSRVLYEVDVAMQAVRWGQAPGRCAIAAGDSHVLWRVRMNGCLSVFPFGGGWSGRTYGVGHGRWVSVRSPSLPASRAPLTKSPSRPRLAVCTTLHLLLCVHARASWAR